MLAAVLRAPVGDPALVHTPEGAPAYWLVPFLDGGRASGFARVELHGKVSQLGAFGAGADDRRAWPEASFFAGPPPRMLEEIGQTHPGAAHTAPLLTYDRSPAHWGWRLDLGPDRGVAFLTPGGWHLVPAKAPDSGREG